MAGWTIGAPWSRRGASRSGSSFGTLVNRVRATPRATSSPAKTCRRAANFSCTAKACTLGQLKQSCGQANGPGAQEIGREPLTRAVALPRDGMKRDRARMRFFAQSKYRVLSLACPTPWPEAQRRQWVESRRPARVSFRSQADTQIKSGIVGTLTLVHRQALAGMRTHEWGWRRYSAISRSCRRWSRPLAILRGGLGNNRNCLPSRRRPMHAIRLQDSPR